MDHRHVPSIASPWRICRAVSAGRTYLAFLFFFFFFAFLLILTFVGLITIRDSRENVALLYMGFSSLYISLQISKFCRFFAVRFYQIPRVSIHSISFVLQLSFVSFYVYLLRIENSILECKKM